MKQIPPVICPIVLCVFALLLIGCGSNSSQAVLPSGELTEAQKAAVKAEDSRIDEEESQGQMNQPKSKKKS